MSKRSTAELANKCQYSSPQWYSVLFMQPSPPSRDVSVQCLIISLIQTCWYRTRSHITLHPQRTRTISRASRVHGCNNLNK